MSNKHQNSNQIKNSNDTCSTLPERNRLSSLSSPSTSMNQQLHILVHCLPISSTPSSDDNRVIRTTNVDEYRSSAVDDSFANGDLIDLYDRDINLNCETGCGSNVNLVEAINSQLLAKIIDKQDCYALQQNNGSLNKVNQETNKFKHTKKLNNSIDLSSSTAVQSIETNNNLSVGTNIASTNSNSNPSNEQHQTVIREFKRIGTYCTLRPEQRRKHLLKVLPTLRNSTLLQTLLGSNNGAGADGGDLQTLSNVSTVDDLLSTNNNDIDSFLIDLDDFIVDGNTALMQQRQKNDGIVNNCDQPNEQPTLINDDVSSLAMITNRYSMASTTSRSDNDSLFKIDPDKVEDCLLELDAYLEEIDRDYALSCAAHGSAHNSNICNNNKNNSNNFKSMKIRTMPTNVTVSGSSEQTSKNGNRWQNQSGDQSMRMPDLTNERRMRCCFDDDDDNDAEIDIVKCDKNNDSIGNSDVLIDFCGKIVNDNQDINLSKKRISNDVECNKQLKRGHKLRNTIAISGQNCSNESNNVATSSNDARQAKKSKLKNPSLSWRRLSMRRTCPIEIPEQNQQTHSIHHRPRSAIQTTPHRYPEDFDIDSNLMTETDIDTGNENNANYCFNDSHSDVAITSNGYLHTDNNNDSNQMPSTSNLSNDGVIHSNFNENDRTNDLSELSSLNNEFLNTILTSNNVPNSPMQTNHLIDSNYVMNLDDDMMAIVASPPAYSEDTRPRQLGRRSEMRSRIVSITAERSAEGNQRIIVNCDTDNISGQCVQPSINLSNQQQPSSVQQRSSNQCQFTVSEPSSGASSRNPSPVSLASSSESSSGDSTSAAETNIRSTPHRTMNISNDPEPSSNRASNGSSNNSSTSSSNSSGGNGQRPLNSKSAHWPFGLSRVFAATCCTLGLFNISRFAIFSNIFGANFIVQFMLLSFFLGIPMLWLQMCLGVNIKSGPISMWRVSPICKGIGIALVLVQALMTIYSSVSIAWLLVYLRDSCVTARYPFYRWQEIFEFFRGPSDNGIVIMSNTSEPTITSSKLGETVADYFNGVILQRYQLGPGGRVGNVNGIGAIRFTLAFNLSIVWLFIFITLCKGLRFYGKIVIAMASLPLIGFAALTIKMLTLLNLNGFQNIFPATDWQDFFVNSQSWLSAAQEAFLTWSLLGASIISIFSKSTKYQQEINSSILRREALIVVALTLIGLLLAAVFGNACVQILNDRGFFYFPGSFETITSSVFLLPSSKPLPPQLATSLSKWLPRYSTLLGESYKRIDPNSFESGWQPFRLITEIFPATLAAATPDDISSFWSLLGFLVFFCFGIAQICAMWKPIASSLVNYSESISATSTTVLLTCLAGLLLGIPLTTETGINIIYFLDSVIGGAWFVLLLWTGQIFAIFLVRGRPYSGDILVNALRLGQTLSAFVALSWNLLLPIVLLTLCVLQYKISYSYDFYHWSGIISQSYWPMWTRKVAAFIQIGIFQIIPITAIVQTYRYLSKGPPDILDRFQLLYRPAMTQSQRPHRYPIPRSERANLQSANNRQTENINDSSAMPAIAVTLESNPVSLIVDDAPPKYTPPPSYATASGARIAKLLRNSIRRSVRRILGEPSCNNRRQRTPIQTLTAESSFEHYQNPPDYSTIIANDLIATTNNENVNQSTQNPNMGPRVTFNNETTRHPLNHSRRHTTTNFPCQKSLEKIDSFSSTMPRRQNTGPSSISNERTNFQNLTASDVAQLLRSTQITSITATETPPIDSEHNVVSFVSPTSIENSMFVIESNSLNNNSDSGQEHEDFSLTRSVEELVLNEIPIGESNAAASFCDKD